MHFIVRAPHYFDRPSCRIHLFLAKLNNTITIPQRCRDDMIGERAPNADIRDTYANVFALTVEQPSSPPKAASTKSNMRSKPSHTPELR